MNNEEEHPLKKIEESQAYIDMGKMGVLVYMGALEESGDANIAVKVTAAYFRGMFGGANDSTNPDEDK